MASWRKATSIGTLWALCSSSASSRSSPKPKPPPPQGNRPHFLQLTGRPDHVGPFLKSVGVFSSPSSSCSIFQFPVSLDPARAAHSSRAPPPHTVISNGAGRLFLASSLLRRGRPADVRNLSPSMRPRKMLVHHFPFLPLLRKHVRAPPVNLAPSPELHAPIKRRHRRPSAYGHVRLLHLVRQLRRPLQVVIKRLPQGPQPANPLVLRRRKPHEPAIKQL